MIIYNCYPRKSDASVSHSDTIMWFAIRRRTPNGTDSASEGRRASFASLIKRRKFDKIIRVLSDRTCNVTAWLDTNGTEEGSKLLNAPFQLFKARLPLHTALQYQPPVELVDLLIGRLGENAEVGTAGVVSTQNMLGQSPLHIAVVNDADISVIERLLQDMPLNALPCDIWGRSPLHWVIANDSAVNVGCFRSTTKKTMHALESKIMIITAIITVFPSCLNIRDNEGFTALELGIRHQSDEALLYVLEQANHKQAGKVNELTVCNTSKSKRFSKAGSRQPSTDTSLSFGSNVDRDIPVEIIEVTDSSWWSDNDDDSSVGTGGVSKFTPSRRRPRMSSRRYYERVQL